MNNLMHTQTLESLGFKQSAMPVYYLKNDMMVYQSPLSEKIILDLNRKEKGLHTIINFSSFEAFVNYFAEKFNYNYIV